MTDDNNSSLIPGVKNVILVLSGKGGVGKSTVSTQLAISLKNKGYKVGLLDIDLCGPSVPFLLGLENASIHQSTAGWVPVYTDESQKLGVISIGFLLNSRSSSVVWRGPKKTSMIQQFLRNVFWDNVDYLVVDTPPGTSDEHITVMNEVKGSRHGAIIVTTPQQVALDDVRKEITLCRKIGINLIGLVENLSGFVCPSCKECSNIWSSGGGASLAQYAGLPLLGVIPIDPTFSELTPSDTVTHKVFDTISAHIIEAHQ